MQFLKEHLKGTHYNLSTEARHKELMSAPDRRIFDRLNGNQMLYLINFFGYSIGKLTIELGQKIENLISKELPVELKSEIAVFNWLRGKYLYS